MTVILGPPNRLVDDHNEAAFNSFPGSVFPIHSIKTVEPHTPTHERQDSPVQKYFVPEMI